MKPFSYLIFVLGLTISCTAPQAQLNTEQLITDLEYLSSDELGGRLVGTEGNERAQFYIMQRFTESGVQKLGDRYTRTFQFERNGAQMEGVNIIGVVPGESESMIVLTAHFDHIGTRDSLIFNGADDNASGTAALLAMAEYFVQNTPRHTIVFAALDAEEGGLNGARAFVKDSVLMENVLLNINMDMIAQNQVNELYAVGTYHYPEFKPILSTIDTGEISLLFGHDRPEDGNQNWTYASDHAPFHELGIPFVYFGVEDHEHYHQHTDEFETIPQEFYKQSVQTILNATIALDEYFSLREE